MGLARAIYNEPACLFLDEPNSALDYNGEKALEKVILSCKDKGMLILIVTHRRSVLGYSDKVLYEQVCVTDAPAYYQAYSIII